MVRTLKRKIKLALAKEYLDKLAVSCSGEAVAALVSESGVLVRSSGAREFAVDGPNVVKRPLDLESVPMTLVMYCPRRSEAEPARREAMDHLMDLAAFSLEQFASLEHARRAVAEETLGRYRELSLLQRSVFELNDSLRLKDVAHALLDECRSGPIPATAGVLFSLVGGGLSVKPMLSFGLDAQEVDRLGLSVLIRDVISRDKGEVVDDLMEDSRWKGEIKALTSLLVMPVRSPGAKEGVLVLGSPRRAEFRSEHAKYLETLSAVAGIAMGNAQNFEGVQTLMSALLKALAEAIDARDPYTAGHSERVARLSVALAKKVNQDEDVFAGVAFDDEQIEELYYSGILHDVGKIGIKEEVLTKDTRLPRRVLEIIEVRLSLYGQITGDGWRDDFERIKDINRSVKLDEDEVAFIEDLARKSIDVGGHRLRLLSEHERECLAVRRGNLTTDERREIERHPAESSRILQHIPFTENLSRLRNIVLQHHERLDGSGYPFRIRGEDILMQSRILAIADIFDAITQERHYKPAYPREEALRILGREAEAGKLDRRLVGLFTADIDEIEAMAGRSIGRAV